MAHVYCPECGYNNPESAHFCAKCGAALVVPEEGESTEAFAAPEVDESLDPIEDLGIHGAALIVRSGGGRSGETFALDDGPATIGRSPECAIFLDDVTSMTRAASTAPSSTASGSRTPISGTATSSRSASTG
jgi:hypothetical protein